MVLDIIVAIIILGAMILGFRTGFVYTFLHMAGWVLSLVLAFVWSPWLKNIVIARTGVDDVLRLTLVQRLSNAAGSEQLTNFLPDLLQNAVANILGQTAQSAATSITDLLLSIICFLLTVFAAKLIFWILIGFLSKRHNDGAVGFLDSLLGLIFGLAKGIILVFLLLAIMVPIASLLDPKWTTFVMESLHSSYFTGTLYDNNLIVLIVRDFLTSSTLV